MNNVVAVNFKEGGKLYFFKGNELNILDGDLVIVETERGIQLAKELSSLKSILCSAWKNISN